MLKKFGDYSYKRLNYVRTKKILFFFIQSTFSIDTKFCMIN